MKKHQKYFIKQKLIGVGLLILPLLAYMLMPEAAVIGLISIPMGLVLVFTKQMVWMDDYFWEVEENKQDYEEL